MARPAPGLSFQREYSVLCPTNRKASRCRVSVVAVWLYTTARLVQPRTARGVPQAPQNWRLLQQGVATGTRPGDCPHRKYGHPRQPVQQTCIQSMLSPSCCRISTTGEQPAYWSRRQGGRFCHVGRFAVDRDALPQWPSGWCLAGRCVGAGRCLNLLRCGFSLVPLHCDFGATFQVLKSRAFYKC